MLILSRQKDQSIVVKSTTALYEFSVLEVRSDEVSIDAHHLGTKGRLPSEGVSIVFRIGDSYAPGEDIRLELVDIRPAEMKARLGVTAPQAFPVHRREVWDAIRHDDDDDGGSAGAPIPLEPKPALDCGSVR